MNKFEIKDFNLSNNYVIEASAGTGKTFNIVNIVDKIVNSKDNPISLDKILVVTYTEKAAGELKSRIGDKLKDTNVDNASIYTIHSFCQNMIKEFGISAKLPLNLNVINKNELVDFVKRYLREGSILEDISVVFKVKTKNTFSESKVIDLFVSGIGKYYLDFNYKEDKSIITFERMDNDREYLTIFKGICLDESFDEICSKVPEIGKQFNVLKNSGEKKSNEFAVEIESKYKELFDFNGRSYQKRAKWPSNSSDMEAFEFFKKLKEDLNSLDKSRLLVSIYLNDLYIKWQEEKERNKNQTFDDMLRYVREKVICEEGFKKKLQDKYTIGIIDEFQDTNQKQFDIFKEIFMDDDNHKLIVVGDPKQSIYSFQGADVNVYYDAVDDITKTSGNKYFLSKNYRSTENIVTSCNKLFQFYDFKGTSFTECEFLNAKEDGEEKILKATYEGEEIKGFWIAKDDEGPIDEHKFAKIAVQTIVDCCTNDANGNTKLRIKPKEEDFRNVTFNDFVVLAKSRSEMDEIQKALSRVGIPNIRYKDDKLFLGKECFHWICLLKAINVLDFKGYNRNKLKKALFTDFFGLSLSLLNSEYVNSDEIKEIYLINKWRQFAYSRKWESMFEDILVNSELSKNNKTLKEIQSLSKFKQIANYCIEYLSKEKTLDDLIKHLTNLADNNESDEEGNGSTVEKGTNFECVRLMTMHASKGLQFPIVIMSGGFKGDPNRSEMYITRKDGQKVLTFKTDDVVADEKTEELKRLFYVAYTRPEYLLILPYYEKVSSNFIKETLESYMLNYPDQYLTLEDSGVSEKELREKVKEILNPLPAEEKDKEAEEKDKEDKEKDNELRNNQMEFLKKLIRKLPSKSAYKHSYSSMSHPKENIETIDEEIEDKEGAETEGQFIFDTNAVQVEPLYNKGINPIVLPIDYPAGSKLGTALHEVFEGLDFTSYEEKLEKKIKLCFNKQGIKLKDEWLEASINIVRNVLNATLPVIEGSCVCDKSFSFKDIPFEDKLDEVEFNFNVLSQYFRNYCNGFIDMIIKRGDYYSIVDWKSDKLNDILDSYSSKDSVKAHVDNCYAVQRVLYSYCLIKWLKTSMPELPEDTIFRNHFGGMYYIFLRGCNEGTGNGIYCQTWKSWDELEKSFNEIVKSKIGGK